MLISHLVSKELFGAILEPGIDIEKTTNSIDADTSPGPQIQVGDTAYFTYVVTNTDSKLLTNVAVTDSEGVTVSCPRGNAIPTLAAFAWLACSATERPGLGSRDVLKIPVVVHQQQPVLDGEARDQAVQRGAHLLLWKSVAHVRLLC